MKSQNNRKVVKVINFHLFDWIIHLTSNIEYTTYLDHPLGGDVV